MCTIVVRICVSKNFSKLPQFSEFSQAPKKQLCSRVDRLFFSIYTCKYERSDEY